MLQKKIKQENQDRTTLAQIFGGVAIWDWTLLHMAAN